MDFKSQYADRYKKDLSTETFRTKLARRKSLAQKESRQREFRKSRRIVLSDLNLSQSGEGDLSRLDAGDGEGPAPKRDAGAQPPPAQQRLDRLRSYKEEKQLRKLREQREKAKRGVFKCGLYKHDAPLFGPPPAKAPADKPPPPPEVRATRSSAKEPCDPTAKASRLPQPVARGPFSSRGGGGAAGRQAQPARPQQPAAPRKQGDKENKVLAAAAPPRTARAALAGATKALPAAATKPVQKAAPGGGQPRGKTAPKENPRAAGAKAGESQRRRDEPSAGEAEPGARSAPAERSRARSFAPLDFQFQPLQGVSAFRFKPMAPHLTNAAFLAPGFCWSPAKKDSEPGVISEPDIVSEPGVTSGPDVISEPAVGIKEVSKSEEFEHDVPYFRDILRAETSKLASMCAHWEQIIAASEVPEDAGALIRTTVGQTRLLIKERFKQFEGLVDDCEFKRGEKETTCTDLDGFWDMVSFQVEDVLKKFANLIKLRDNDWQQATAQDRKVPKKKIVRSVPSKPSQPDGARAAARSRLAAIKAAVKKQIKQEDVLPQAPNEDLDKVVFDAGFFKVESPAKLAMCSSSKAHRSRSTQGLSAKTESSGLKILNLDTVDNSSISRVADHPVQAEDDVHYPQILPNNLVAPVKKVLLGSATHLLSIVRADESSPMVETPDTATLTISANIVDAGDERLSSTAAKPYGIHVFQHVASPEVDGMESSAYPATQDVEMHSPEKSTPPFEDDTSMAEEPEMLVELIAGDTAPEACWDPLDFFRNDTPPNLTKSLIRPEFAAVTEATDLMVFSPVANAN